MDVLEKHWNKSYYLRKGVGALLEWTKSAPFRWNVCPTLLYLRTWGQRWERSSKKTHLKAQGLDFGDVHLLQKLQSLNIVKCQSFSHEVYHLKQMVIMCMTPKNYSLQKGVTWESRTKVTMWGWVTPWALFLPRGKMGSQGKAPRKCYMEKVLGRCCSSTLW